MNECKIFSDQPIPKMIGKIDDGSGEFHLIGCGIAMSNRSLLFSFRKWKYILFPVDFFLNLELD